MATYPYFAITDGSTTITFMDGAGALGNYTFERAGWAPAVANRRLDELNATGEWDDVAETIPIIITGASVAAFYANANALKQLLDKADQYWMGLTNTPVTVRWVPQGSTRTTSQYYEALILGRAAGDQTAEALTLGPRWLEGGNTGYGLGLSMSFWRRGLWLNETDTATSASTAPGAVWSATLGTSWAQASPCDVRWQLPTLSATRGYYMGGQMLAITDSASNITAIEAESGAYGANIATTVIANARGGNVARYTPGALQSDITLTGMPTAVGRYAIYASLSTNSPNAGQFTVRANMNLYGSSGLFNPLITVPSLATAGQTCDALQLGIITIPIASSARNLVLELNSSTSVGGYVLDVDYVVLVKLTPTTTIITVDPPINRAPLFGFGDFGASATQRQNLQHLLTSSLYPIPYIETNTGSVQGLLEGVNGSLVIPVTGTNVSGIWMAANHANASTAEFNGGYRVADAANAVYSSAYTVTRRRGYLIPE